MEPARRAVAAWQDRLAAAARNIADLGESDDVRRLRARLAGDHAFEGATLAAARRVAAALDGLWADYLLVSRTVEEAAALLRRPLFGPSRGDEAVALLEGASIRLPAVSVPLRARGLLDAAERSQAVTPAAVLDAMVDGYEAARRGASAIAAAETAGRVKLGALRAEPAAGTPDLAARIAAAAAALERDPLGAAGLLGPLLAALADGRAEAEAATRRRAALDGALRRARADLAEMRLSPDRGAADGLAPWLDRLAVAVAAGQVEAATVGLARWAEACAAAAAVARERDDLRGRFRALRAKADALRAGGRDPRADPAPVAAALDGEPFDAARARALLGAYEASLAGRRGADP